MKKLSVAVLDDNKIALSSISSAVEKAFRTYDIETDLRCFERVSELSDFTRANTFDLLLLDIDLEDGDGVKFAQTLRAKGDMIDIIFVSGREDRVFDALNVHPFGFVRKSNFFNDISSVVASYIPYKQSQNGENFIVLNSHGGQIRVETAQIKYIEGQGRLQNVYLKTTKEPLTVSESMEDFEQKLSGEGFMRIHKGYILNYRFVQVIVHGEVKLISGELLPVSRQKLKEVKEWYLTMMSNDGAKLF